MEDNTDTVPKDAGFAARSLLREACWGTLATQGDGQPFASLVTPAIAPDGAVLMLLSSLATHSRHLEAEPRCAVMVAGKPENLNWHTAPRLTVTGKASRLADDADGRAARRYWVAHHPYARLYADFADFSIWRLVAEAGLFIGGFGRFDTLDAAQLACDAAATARLAAGQAAFLAEYNGSHGGELARLAHAAGHGGRWEMMGVDPDGFTLVQDETVMRIAFAAPVPDVEGARAGLKRLLQG
jgi:putative heme iron utilization protein